MDPFGLSLLALCRCCQPLSKGESKGETGPAVGHHPRGNGSAVDALQQVS